MEFYGTEEEEDQAFIQAQYLLVGQCIVGLVLYETLLTRSKEYL